MMMWLGEQVLGFGELGGIGPLERVDVLAHDLALGGGLADLDRADDFLTFEGEFVREDLAAVFQDDGLGAGETSGGEQKAANSEKQGNGAHDGKSWATGAV